MAWTVSSPPHTPLKAWFIIRPVLVGFVVDIVPKGRVFCQYVGFVL
jgi:hypothetical protein